MRNRLSLILYFLFIALFPECVSGKVATGAERFEQYLPFIRGKRVGMVVNHTSVVGTKQTHLLDTLLKQNINVIKVFAPRTWIPGKCRCGGDCERRKRFAHRSSHRFPLRQQQKADCRPTKKTSTLSYLIFRMWEHASILISVRCIM